MPIMTSPEIEQLEKELSERSQRVAELKKELPRRPVPDYRFKNHTSGETSLSELFGEHAYLVIIHNMGKKCKYCTMWANVFEGIYRHFHDKAGFVVINHDSIAVQKAFAKEQGWTFPMYSAAENDFSMALGFTDKDNNPWPGVSTFHKKENGELELIAQASFGPNDLFCTVWHLYGLLPEKYDY